MAVAGSGAHRAGILTSADAVPFAGYCQAYARWKEAEQEVSKLGIDDQFPIGIIFIAIAWA